ncbi:MAG: LysM peptidoglycan-binding domain-containing protein [Oscillospiraceae bacterium]|nr:LysM peptidoglycan-binding domain-containing protein [Oscillospiraceae bacterium]
MKFKDYVWPHNPKVYEIRFKKDIVSHRVPFGLYVLQNTGRSHRVLRGEGEFSGEGAYMQFRELGNVFYDSTPGTLVHPLWMTTKAYFASLELVQEPREDYVKYSFEFWECYDGYDTAFKRISVNNDDETSEQESRPAVAEPKYYTVKNGDTMSGIAMTHSMTLEKLIELNPQVSNINLIHTGQQLRVG